LGGDRRTEEDAVSTVSGLDDEGDVAGTATAEEDDVQRHRLLPVIRYLRALRGGDREARVRVRGGATRIGRPLVALPVDEVRRRGVGQPLPPHVAVRPKSDVREDRVAPERLDGGDVGRLPRAGCDPE